MGDYLRYAMYDKYFKKIGNCVGPSACPAGTGKDASHYLLSWYYAWGGSTDTTGGWAWRIGSSHAHSGYQNPLAAYALSSYADLKPKSATGQADWSKSLSRQLEFYRWLQSDEGAIAGGATNSWAGRYATPPAGKSTFYGMYYDEQPVYHDPPSNQWFGFQAWSMERVAELYQQTGNTQAKAVLDKWVKWALSKTTINPDGTYRNYQDSLGIAVPENRADYSRFNDSVYIPSGFSGTMPNGDKIDSSSTFASLRSFYKNDPAWSKIEAYLKGGAVPSFTYHRFWAQADIALAMGSYAELLE